MKMCLYNERSDPEGAGARSRLWDEPTLRRQETWQQPLMSSTVKSLAWRSLGATFGSGALTRWLLPLPLKHDLQSKAI